MHDGFDFGNSYGCKYVVLWNDGWDGGRLFFKKKVNANRYAKSVFGKVVRIEK